MEVRFLRPCWQAVRRAPSQLRVHPLVSYQQRSSISSLTSDRSESFSVKPLEHQTRPASTSSFRGGRSEDVFAQGHSHIDAEADIFIAQGDIARHIREDQRRSSDEQKNTFQLRKVRVGEEETYKHDPADWDPSAPQLADATTGRYREVDPGHVESHWNPNIHRSIHEPSGYRNWDHLEGDKSTGVDELFGHVTFRGFRAEELAEMSEVKLSNFSHDERREIRDIVEEHVRLSREEIRENIFRASAEEMDDPYEREPDLDRIYAKNPEDHPNNPINRVRVVPASPSYFTALPRFTDDTLHLENLLRACVNLPVLPPGQAPRVAWQTYAQYKVSNTEPIGKAQYAKLLRILHRLNYIHPAIIPAEVTETLNKYKRAVQPSDLQAKPIPVDRFGRARAVGRRKSSHAVVWLVEGTGEVAVNGQGLNEVFVRLHDRESALWALKATARMDKYNVWAVARGGGTTGQAEAITLGLAKALMAHEPALKPALRRAGCITRDTRVVERKKHGKLKARKMPAWVRR